MPESKHLNYYGFLGLWVSLLSLASYFVLYTRSCVETDYNRLDVIQILGTVVGLIVFVISFFNIAEKLYKRKCIFYSIVAVITMCGFVMLFGAYSSIIQNCTIKMFYERNFELLKNSTRFKFEETEVDNFFQVKYGHNIVLFVFDLCSAVLFWIIAYTFRRRV